ncbi:hypothetical protein JXQ31_04100 [candidate division KSB1 bacterium]|nr:hypothetical protein [candidate division KSB1 bacterium]
MAFKIWNYNFLLLFSLFILCLFPAPTTAQYRQRVALAADFYTDIQYDRVTGNPQQRPEWIRTFTFVPQIDIPGLPTINFLIKVSSLESMLRQPFNRYLLRFSPTIGPLSFGDSYPVFSRYTLNGILVRGGALDTQLGPIRLAAAAGKSKRAVSWRRDVINPSFNQYLYGVKFGLGKEQSSHIHVNLLKVKDDSASIETAGYKKPGENLVVGLDCSVFLFDKTFNLDGEIAGSAFSRDIQARKMELPAQVPDFTTKLFQPRASSQYDWVLNLKAGIRRPGGSLNGSFLNIGPGFYSLGTPYLHNDIRQYQVSATRRLIKNKLLLSAGLSKFHDNLANWKKTTTFTRSGHFNSNIMLRKFPSFNFGYRFYSQRNSGAAHTRKINNLNQTLLMGIMQRFSLFNRSYSLRLLYSNTWNRSKNFFINNDYDSHIIRLSASASLRRSLSVFSSVGFMRTQIKRNNRKDERFLYNAGISSSFLNRRLTSNLRFNYDEGETSELFMLTLQDTTRLTTRYNEQKRFSLGLICNFQLKRTTLSFNLERIIYRNTQFTEFSYHELLARFTFYIHFGGKEIAYNPMNRTLRY